MTTALGHGLSNVAAIAGIGDTDYAVDYRRPKDDGSAPDAYGYAAIAFDRALKDAGIGKDEIDGLVVGPTLAMERTGEVLGLETRWSAQGDAANAVVLAAMALNAGLAECIALVYGNNQRTAGKRYGGATAAGDTFLAYVYYAPWGLTSQGALYAMMTQRYLALHGLTSADLGHIAVAQRQFAALNENAVMHDRITIDDYRTARLICDPLRLFDYCLINDGGVALIMTTPERAKRMRQPVVRLAGVGMSNMNVDATSLRPRLIDFYRPAHRAAADAVYANAGVGPEEIDLVQIYDSFSPHIVFALEGFGYCEEGGAIPFIAAGHTAPGGKLPVNTSGGHLSESYMQGWNHQVEIVRQLRGQAGARQVGRARHAQYISDVAGKAASMIYAATP